MGCVATGETHNKDDEALDAVEFKDQKGKNKSKQSGIPNLRREQSASSVIARLVDRASAGPGSGGVDLDSLEFGLTEFRQTSIDPVLYFHNDYYGQNEYILSPFINNKHRENDNKENEKFLHYKLPIMYCDWTASGKNLKCIENYIDTVVRPLYANTHTQTSVTGKQTTMFRNEARNMILNSDSIKGDIKRDVLIFCGNGVTGAIYKMANILMNSKQFYKPENTVVFVGIYEHNSNLLIWKELGIKVIVIPEYEHSSKDKNKYGINIDILETYLEKYSNDNKYNLLIGSFSAASNVSGIIEKAEIITDLLHKYNALSFWDYATGGPYLDMKFEKKDAIFLSPHKFLGGPDTPGILLCKRKLCQNEVPVVAGGGTVFWSFGPRKGVSNDKISQARRNSKGGGGGGGGDSAKSPLLMESDETDEQNNDNDSKQNNDIVKVDEYEYLHDTHIEEREEGGTPQIIGSIRCALVFLVKDIIGVKTIEKIEHSYFDKFLLLMKKEIESKKMQIIGNLKCKRLPIISFNVMYKNRFLHYNYVAALLNDLFGIQGRGGCSCAGMYGITELREQVEIDVAYILDQLRKENELARLGYYRINFHYTLTKSEFEYIIKCLKYICEHGWKFMALYTIDVKSGLYIHRSQVEASKNDKTKLFYASLKDIRFQKYSSGRIGATSIPLFADNDTNRSNRSVSFVQGMECDKISNFDECFEFADNILSNMKHYLPSQEEMDKEEKVNDDINKRFYWLPSEIYDDICQLDNPPHVD